MEGWREVSHSGVLRQKPARMATQILALSAEVGVTSIMWGLVTMGWGGLCVCPCLAFAVRLPTLSNRSHSLLE